MAIPLPGNPVRGSKTGKPIMALFDLMGRGWAMGIVWNLTETACTFRELQRRCESISPTILNSRLKELRGANLVDHVPGGYVLTPLGSELRSRLLPLGQWSKRWASLLKTQLKREETTR